MDTHTIHTEEQTEAFLLTEYIHVLQSHSTMFSPNTEERGFTGLNLGMMLPKTEGAVQLGNLAKLVQ